MEEGLSSFAPSGGRSQMETLKSGTRVFCDFYNANPASMRAAFKVVLDCSKANSTKWLCLADMKELGTSEEELHRQLAADIRGMGANTKVLLLGEKMKWLADELRKRDPQIHVSHVETHDLLALELKQSFKKDDVVLLKGSRSMRMEKVWELIKA
jgi:UDP-N-acetylmuramoyl-tripeptide--D-alanyl-D-alanine ligase